METQGLVGLVPWTFVFTVANLFLTVFVMKKFLFKPINDMLEKRKALADAEIQDAIKAKEEAQAMKAEYELNMQDRKIKRMKFLFQLRKQPQFRVKKC